MSDRNGDYEVGYGRPPRQHQWKKGQSGNTRGRPRGLKSLKTELQEVLAKKVGITRNGRPATASMQRLLLENITTVAAKGDMAAARLVVQMINQNFGVGEDRDQAAPTLRTDEREVMDAYIAAEARRILREGAGDGD